jgi:hypothetical protein
MGKALSSQFLLIPLARTHRNNRHTRQMTVVVEEVDGAGGFDAVHDGHVDVHKDSSVLFVAADGRGSEFVLDQFEGFLTVASLDIKGGMRSTISNLMRMDLENARTIIRLVSLSSTANR